MHIFYLEAHLTHRLCLHTHTHTHTVNFVSLSVAIISPASFYLSHE